MIWHNVDGYAVKIELGPAKDFRARFRLSATKTLGFLHRNPLVRKIDNKSPYYSIITVVSYFLESGV
jgi:hypothetical protein